MECWDIPPPPKAVQWDRDVNTNIDVNAVRSFVQNKSFDFLELCNEAVQRQNTEGVVDAQCLKEFIHQVTDTLLIENDTTPPYSVRMDCVNKALEQIVQSFRPILNRKDVQIEALHHINSRHYQILGLSSVLLKIFNENYCNNVKLCSFAQGRINYILTDEIKKSQKTLKRTSVSVNVDTTQQSTDLDTISTETVKPQKKSVKF